MRGRLTRSVVDPAALLRNAKPLTGRDGETKKKKKRKNKQVLRDAPNRGFENLRIS